MEKTALSRSLDNAISKSLALPMSYSLIAIIKLHAAGLYLGRSLALLCPIIPFWIFSVTMVEAWSRLRELNRQRNRPEEDYENTVAVFAICLFVMTVSVAVAAMQSVSS